MDIPVACNCGKSFKAKASLAGKTVACPGCKSPITIPMVGAGAQQAAGVATPPQAVPPQAPVPPAPAAPAEIVMTCNCGQQFKVESRFAGQQVACPACQSPCVIPSPQGQGGYAAPAQPAMPQQPMAQQPMMQPPTMQQPMMQPPGYGAPPDYQQPVYQQPMGGYAARRPSHKTGLGIFIFAIAACVFGGGFAMQRIAEGVSEIRFISIRASAKKGGSGFSASSARSGRTINNLTSALVKIGAVAMLLAMVGIVVASVFCIMSPPPLMGLGIAEVTVSAIAAILLSIYEYVPVMQDRGFGMNILGSFFGSYMMSNDVGESLLGLLVRYTEIATFLMFSIFLIFALAGKRGRGVNPDQPKISLITFSIAAGIHLILMILGLVKFEAEAMIYVFMLIRWVAHAAMIVGLVFLIKTSFEAKAVYRL